MVRSRSAKPLYVGSIPILDSVKTRKEFYRIFDNHVLVTKNCSSWMPLSHLIENKKFIVKYFCDVINVDFGKIDLGEDAFVTYQILSQTMNDEKAINKSIENFICLLNKAKQNNFDILFDSLID